MWLFENTATVRLVHVASFAILMTAARKSVSGLTTAGAQQLLLDVPISTVDSLA